MDKRIRHKEETNIWIIIGGNAGRGKNKKHK
jgi:hypothetical protein